MHVYRVYKMFYVWLNLPMKVKSYTVGLCRQHTMALGMYVVASFCDA